MPLSCAVGYARSLSCAPSSTKKKSGSDTTSTGTVPSGNPIVRITPSEPSGRSATSCSTPGCATQSLAGPDASSRPGPPIAIWHRRIAGGLRADRPCEADQQRQHKNCSLLRHARHDQIRPAGRLGHIGRRPRESARRLRTGHPCAALDADVEQPDDARVQRRGGAAGQWCGARFERRQASSGRQRARRRMSKALRKSPTARRSLDRPTTTGRRRRLMR